MKTNTKIKLEDALENAENYIEQMKSMDDKNLASILICFVSKWKKHTSKKTKLPLNY